MKAALFVAITCSIVASSVIEGAAIVLDKQGSIKKPQTGECSSYDREKTNEGYKKCVYKDSMGHPTIGVGCNLDKFGAKAEIESVGADYDKVLAGTQCLDDSQIHKIFDMDMAVAVSCADRFVGDIAEDPKSAVQDMAFNMGCATLETFRTFASLLKSGNYSGAADDMKRTAWCGQVGYRCDRDVACVRKG